jgi:iron complex transport system ATP-binding protein
MAAHARRWGHTLVSAFLEARRVSYHRRGRALVDAVSLEVSLGRFTIVIGPNGAGKSTLLRLLSGELTPTAGVVACDGARVESLAPWRLAHRRAVMTQAVQLSFSFTVREVGRLGLEGVGAGLSVRRREQIVELCLATADVLPLASRRYDSLSGGEQRRVQFARALAQLEAGRTMGERQALLLDEPVANLDLRHQLALLDAAQAAAARGVAVFAVLHDLNLAARYADTLAIMSAGVIMHHGPPVLVLSQDLLSRIFEVELSVTTMHSNGNPFVTPRRWLEGTVGGQGSQPCSDTA